MVEADIIVFAAIAVLLLHAFNTMLPYRHPEEFKGEEMEDRRPVSTV